MQEAKAAREITIDLPNQLVCFTSGHTIPFDVHPHLKRCLVEGLDDISLTLQHTKDIAAFEKQRTQEHPWMDGNGYLKANSNGKIAVLAEGRMDW